MPGYTSNGAGWLQYWKSSVVVVSVGANNLYGHPSGEVLARLIDRGMLVYRTISKGRSKCGYGIGEFRLGASLRLDPDPGIRDP
ncbi:hypothetical protein [Paenibacillus durus]|uniref:hypothetical protein n=1 Tax=Paenibacillus durus TaxID=44251 RepID=UPI000AC92A53|nr:hypothetical protein [Paenibacillus durus]